MTILCTIDLLTREVFLPADQCIASYDHNVDVIRFQAEPIEDFSLDTSSIKIAAQGPNKARHDYAVDPSAVQIEEETGYITFDWPIPAGVTEMPLDVFKYGDKGQLIFAVCAEIISGSTVSKAWHSDDGIITVVAHLEPESGGGEDPSEEATNAQKIAQLQTDVAVINTQVRALANGSPAPVATVAEMTDESAVYLYTGSETGYTAGNWYFWNGSAWTSGGTYGGAVTDTTLSISGAPADAKAVGDALAEKADADDVTALDTRVTAVEGDVSDLKEDLTDVENWLGYLENLFDARDLTASNTTNWSIDSATKTSVTITHKNTFSTGYPIAILDLPSGDYIFHADYTNSAMAFSLLTDGSWVKALTDGAEFTIDSAKENAIYFSNDIVGTYEITDISVVAKEESSGKIHTLEDAASTNAAKIADLEEGFNSIAIPSIGPMDGTETQARAIRYNGDIYTAGSNNFRISRYRVSPGKTYWITATTSWGNALWCFYDSNDSVVEVGTVSASGSDDTTIIDREVTAPVGSAYLVIAYNPTVKNGAVKTQTGYTIGAKWRGKKWACVGDSLTAENIRTTKHYFDYVADATGITTVNMGYSGSGYARLSNENHAFYQRISDCPTDADVVTIFGSFNDLGAGLPIGTVNDTGTDTLAGCINTTITNLQTVIPLVNLGIVAPTPWATTVPATSGEDFNYVEMIKAICERRSIPFLDLWRCSNLRPWDADFRAIAYSKDGGSGTHPDENGHKLIAPRFKAFLETLLM